METLDNINHLWGDDLKHSIKPSSKLKIIASGFSIYAFEALKKELETIDSLQFIFTAPTFVPNEVTDRGAKTHREFHIPKPQRERERDIYGNEFEIQLRNKLTQRAIAKECADWIRRKVEFRSNFSKTQMQQFACLQNGHECIVYTSLQEFTAVGLGYQRGNLVSNFIQKIADASSSQTYLQLFNQIWDDASMIKDVTDTVCMNIESVYRESSPEKIYFLMLYNIFKEFLEDLNEDVLPNESTGYKDSVVWNKLYNFQKDAATGIINKLERYNGCILADSVGLGKTFTALAVIKYYELRNRSVLVLCPKRLAENWTTYNQNLKTNTLEKDRFRYDVLCHTDLQRTTGVSLGISLDKINWNNYDLVVIDESHNFRNNAVYKDRETRYQKLMNMVIKGGVQTKVLMLSATPVNNKFNDLKNQLALTYAGDSETLNNKLRTGKTIEEIFRHAQKIFNEWSELPAAERTTETILNRLDFDFFELLDNVTIARSRKHIETFYDTKDIGTFPVRRKPLSFHPKLTNCQDSMDFDDIYEKLSLLTLSVYAPVSYIFPSRREKYEQLYDTDVRGGKGRLKQSDREKNLQSLMTINLLKRLESSVEAFRKTLINLKERHEAMLTTIEQFNQSKLSDFECDFVSSMTDFESEDDLSNSDNFKIGDKIQVDLKDIDIQSWETALLADQNIISTLYDEMQKITPEDDAKLQHLISHVEEKINQPINRGNKKVIIFTASADTVDYLYDNLSPYLLELGIHTAKVTGSNAPKTTLKRTNSRGEDFQSILTLFSPVSKEKALILPDEPGGIDVLIGTDCIAEGQNLQDCDYLINYDIHWNPVRVIQRFGRIDRIGSQNASIQLVNYWPDISLDEYINLRERVETKMIIADVTATGDDNVLIAESSDAGYRKEQLQRLQNEVIELENLKTGVNITDLGLNDFRMDLLKHANSNADLEHLPNGLHALVPADEKIDLKPGVIFTLRNRNPDINVNRHNRLHPYYLIYIDNDGQVIRDHTQVKLLLDSVRSSCRGENQPILSLCKEFNIETKDGGRMEKYSELLNQAIREIVQVKEEKDIDSLFSGVRTSALEDPVQGMDDFELINFLVIKDEK